MKAIEVSLLRRATATGLALALLLGGCGGGEQVAGVGSGGSGGGPTAIGTTTGFGSVIVDGARWDDAATTFEIEHDPRIGATAVAAARLGQRVQIAYRTEGVAERVRIEPAVIGSVESLTIGMPTTTIRIAGQDVRINADPDRGPVTYFERFSDLAALLPGALTQTFTEVHGTLVWDAGRGRHVLEASRIEKLAALPAGLMRVTGVVSGRDAGGFRLGNLTVRVTGSTLQLPLGRALADGQVVSVWGRDLVAGPAPTLTADALRIRDLPATATTTLAGTVGRLDGAARSFDLAGLRVDAGSAVIVPANQTLADGQYAIVRGSLDASGTLQASQVRIRRKADGPEVELRGTIGSYQSDASFVVRGVQVDAAGVTQRPACPATLRDGLTVHVEGGIVDNSVVVATTLRCTP